MIRYLGVIAGFILVGCKAVHVGDLRKEFEGQAYLRSVEASQHVVEVRYVPNLKRLVERAGWEDTVLLTGKILDSLRRSMPSVGPLLAMTIRPKDDSRSFDLSQDLVYGKTSGYTDYQQALENLQFGLKERIWIETRGHKIPLSHYHMENSFGMTRGRIFLLSFGALDSAAGKKQDSLTLVLDDLVPGLSRRRISWNLPIGEYDEKI